MFRHASSYASKWTSGLIIIVVICQSSSKCINNAPPKPQPKPRIEEEPETTLRPARIHPHKLTPPPLPSGSIDSYDSDQHNYNLTASGEYRNKYGVNRYGVQKKGQFNLGLQYWADDEVMLMFPRYPPLRSFEKHYGRYGGLNARKFWAHWNIPEDRSANGFHSGINSDTVLGGRPPPWNSKDFEYSPNAYPKRYYQNDENPKKIKRVQRALPNVKKEVQNDLPYNMDMVNPYDMGGRPPPGKTERRKKKTAEMAATIAIRNKRSVTAQMSDDRQEQLKRVKRALDSDGFEGNMLSRLLHPRIPLKNKTLQRTLSSGEGGFQTDVYYNDNPMLESLVEYDDSKVRKMYMNDSSGEYVESDEGERDYLLDPHMTTRDDPFREFVFFTKVKKDQTTTVFKSVENDTSCFSFCSNSSAIEEDVDTLGYPPICQTTNLLQRLLIEDDPHHYDSDFHIVTETLRKRNKIDGHKRSAFKSWMSKIVPEHAPHIEKLHEKGIDKLMAQKAHGMDKTYGELFHEHHEKMNTENELQSGKHEPHHFGMHEAEHDPHHREMHGAEHEPHHFDMHEGHEPNHYAKHEGSEGYQHEMHEGHKPHIEIHAKEHDEHHFDKEKKAHHMNEAELEEEHRKKAHKSLLEEMYLRKEEKEKEHHEIKDKHELEEHEHEHEEVAQAQTAAPAAPAQPQAQQQQQYQQQLYQQQQQQNQMYQQQQNYGGNNYNNYGGVGGMGGGMGMNGMGMGGMGGMNGMGMGGMGMNGMGMNGMGMNGMGMGQMGGLGAIINAVGNNLPKLSQPTAQAQQANYPGGPQPTQQNYPGGQNYGGPNYPQSPAANGPDPNIQNAQDAAAAQQKAAQDQEAQVQQPDTQDSTAIQDKDQDTSQDSSVNAKADASDDDIKADHSNDGQLPDDLNLPSEDTINAQQDNNAQADNNAQLENEQAPQFDNMQQNPQFDNAQMGQFGQFDNGQNSVNMAAAAAG